MKKRKMNRTPFVALAGLLFFALCLAPAVQVAGDSNNNRSFPMAGSTQAQGKDDSILSPEATYTFQNSNPISIPDSGPGSPYPLNIRVSNIPSDPILKVRVSIQQIQHTFPDDIDILLVGPQGQTVLLMSDAGGDPDINLVTLTFDDAASSLLPDNGPLVDGTFKPTNYGAGDTFPAPAPAGPYSSALIAFYGTNPLGFWHLYVVDDAGGDSGAILLGWSLTIETLAVTNTNDSGPGSLRQAIINANSNSDLSTIPFRIPGAGPFEIPLSSALPAITSPVIIDATTQSGYAGAPLVQINGLNAGSANGLTISSGGSTVKGLGIVAFSGNGILLDPGGGNTIQGCYIGLNIGGQLAQPNSGHGIDMGPGSSNNLIGGTTAAARNVISGNGQYGIVLGSSGQVVQGNYIGTNADGTVARGNTDYGIGIFGANMTIGGTAAGARNVISGNHNRGILITGSASNITVQGNYIGTNAAGNADLGNLEAGILINGTSFNTIGGTAAGAGNVISGNDKDGIQILGAATGNLIYGNYIGTDSTGTFAVGNSSDGVEINGTSNATVGGTIAGAGNVISGNGGNGIYITNASGNSIQGNYIGLSAGGGSSLGNVMTGIFMEVSDNNQIGGTTTGARNVISGNGQYGMVLGSSGQVVQGNYIGTTADGSLDLGNARDGIAMFGFNALIGGTTAAARNIISGNNENGIQIAGSASGNTIAGNYIGTDAIGLIDIGNTLNGVLINGTSNNAIGGNVAGAGNIIAFNGEDGVAVVGGASTPIRGNSIFHNYGGLGIDLSPNGVTLNDPGDGDTGSNNLQNFPVLLTAISNASGTVVNGTLNSTANTSLTLEFFYDFEFDATTYGEGKAFFGSTVVTTDGSGNANFTFSTSFIATVSYFVTATATRNSAPLDTSEFSQALRITSTACSGANTTVVNTNDSGPGSLRQAIINANATIGVTETICFNITGNPPFTITPLSFLPGITDPVIIDGTTQFGFSGAPIVELDGANAGAQQSGLGILAGGSTIKGLVINRFGADGIEIVGNGNTIQGCYLGTDVTGTMNLGNLRYGVLMAGGAQNNTIGGTTASARNIISGKTTNNWAGIAIDGNGTNNNVVQGNYIGTDVTGTVSLVNGGAGVDILAGAQGNIIGGATAGTRNIISGNGSGVRIANNGTNNNVVQGNYIGTNASGTAALGNFFTGVFVNSGAQNNTIGGATAGARNIISGTSSGFYAGVYITDPGTNNNLVQGNYIGTDVTGTLNLGNVGNGVEIDAGAQGNIIGGATAGARNIISGNTIYGVYIVAPGTNNNVVQGNYIGTDVTGTAALGNNLEGVDVYRGQGNIIGGATANARNIISGNNGYGVSIGGSEAANNLVQGNYIGTDVAGTIDLGNTAIGVRVVAGAHDNTIGGTTAGARNIISGNHGGVLIGGDGANNNLIQGNYIGTDTTGTANLGNTNQGVEISTGANNNTIGGVLAGAGNTIAFNSPGVSISGGIQNAVLSNSIHSNMTLGIDLNHDGVTPNDGCDTDTGANNLQNYPVITSALTSGSTTTIQGMLFSTSNTTFKIQFFSNAAADPSGFGEGQTFIGQTSVTTDGSCAASFNYSPAVAVPVGNFITATATDPNNNTSEFSQSRQVGQATAIEFAGATATGFDDGVLLEWRTGMEVDNLGFNLYREEAGKQTRINAQLLAGSALTIGQGVVLRSGFSYSWWDDKPANQEARYWIEDVDLNGLSAWHGPFYAKAVGGKPPAHAQAIALSQSARTHDSAATHAVEAFAQLARVSQAVASAASLQQADLAASRAVKIGIKQAGWYRLTQAELVNAGLDPKTDPHRLRLFADGVEVPIAVVGEADGNFDAGDAVEFYGLGLNTPATDTRIYWLTAGAAAGLRINKTPFAKGDQAGESFACTVERRDRSVYFAALRNGDEENFFGAIITGDAVEQKLTINNLAPSASESAVIEVSLQGVTNLAHQVSVSLNGSPIGYLAFTGQAKGQQKIEVSQSLLREGENVVTFQSSGGPGDISLVDFIRVTYQHSYRADNDSLSFTAKGGHTTTISGFSSKDIRVFDVTEERQVEELSLIVDQTRDGYAATVTASRGSADAASLSERKLVALTDEKVLRVLSLNLNSPSNLRNGNGDFIIITRSELAESAGPLIALRRSQGFSVALVDVADIYDEFSFGEKTPYAVKDFLAFAESTWKKKPRFVLLAGDASYDPRNYLGFGDLDFVPTRLIDTEFMETASDDWFSDFSGDGIEDIATGRLPARTTQELSTMVAKIIAYEQSGTADEAVLVADANDGYDFEQAVTDLGSLIPSILRITSINRGRLGTEMARRSLFDALYRKPLLVNYVGHGSVNQWRASLLTNEDAFALRNDHLPLFLMMTCLNGYFQNPALDSLGESLLKAERGGAVAVWASSGMTMPDEQAVLNREIYRSLFNRRPAIPLGDAIMAAKASVGNADIRRTWILLGDPATKFK